MEVTLNKNGWHKRLQKYVFKHPPTFNNLCPYFWITNFCILVVFIIPIVPLFKLIGWIFSSIDKGIDKLSSFIDTQICQPVLMNNSLRMNEDEILKSWVIYQRANSYGQDYNDSYSDMYFLLDEYYGNKIRGIREKKRLKFEKQFEVWKENHPDWKTIILKLREDRKEAFAKKEKEREALLAEMAEQEKKDKLHEIKVKARRQKMFVAIVKYTKWIGWLLLLSIATIVLYGAYNLVNWGIAHFNYPRFIAILQITGFILSAIIIVTTIVWLFRSVLTKCSVCICNSKIFDNKVIQAIGKALYWLIHKTLVIPGINIWKFLGFFWEYLKVAKKDYCPSIEWKEDSE